MFGRFAIFTICWLLASSTFVLAVNGDEYDPLLARLPASTNAIILIDAEKIFASEYAKQQNWRSTYAKRFDSNPSMLPPTTKKFVWGTELRLETMSPGTQYAVMNLSRDLSMPQLAKWRGGNLNVIDALQAVATPTGGMAIKFSQVEYGVMQPASRQKAARWIRESSDTSQLRLSSYLESVLTDDGRRNAHICQAIDLTDSVDRQVVGAALAQSAVVMQHGLDVDRVADLLAGIRGVNVLVSFADQPRGKLMIDFQGNASVLGDNAKALVVEVLNEAGASLSELPQWSATTDEHTITLQGPLGESGLMRMFTFLEMDPGVLDANDHQAEDGAAGQASAATEEERYANDPAQITREYYESVQKYLHDLSRERGAKSYYSIAVWYDKYAKRIERLPILNVDSGMLDYSETVIGHLRAAADSIQAGGVRTAARGKQITTSNSVDYGYRTGANGYGYRVFSGGANYAASQVANVEAERRAIRAQEKGQSTLDAKGHLAAIEEETLRIRREMTEKYGIEF